jgi:signal transduction histidine kinase
MTCFSSINNLPVKQKLLLVIMATTLMGLVLASAAFLGYDRYQVKKNMAQDISALGRLIADRSAAALVFDDPHLAEKNLAALRVKSSIVAACIYGEDGIILASYSAKDVGKERFPAVSDTLGHAFTSNSLTLFESVELEGKRIGTVYVRANLKELDTLWKQYLAAAALIIFLVSLVVFFLSSRLQRIISEPLIHLTDTTQRIAQQNDYSLRAVKEGEDELGLLVDAFNGMLETIEVQNKNLESTVATRTSELTAANIKLKELDTLKSMFIASMSHELRTPLNSIIGFTGMTLQGLSGDLNEEQKDNLSRAYQSAKHLLSLITDVIDISKIEAGRIDTYPETIFLKTVVSEAIIAIEPQLKEKGLSLDVEVPSELQLNTDKKRLLQCIINLLSNGVKFTEKGGIRLTASERGADVDIVVTDTGIGIAENDLPKLFEAFERLDTHLRVKAGGTGLGLYLTRKIVTDLLQGNISIKSTFGQGSTFTLTVAKDLSPVAES